jgi:hypothetical protein
MPLSTRSADGSPGSVCEALGQHCADDTCDPVSELMAAEELARIRKTLEALDPTTAPCWCCTMWTG